LQEGQKYARVFDRPSGSNGTGSPRWIGTGSFRSGFCWEFFTDEKYLAPWSCLPETMPYQQMLIAQYPESRMPIELQVHRNPVSGPCSVFDSKIIFGLRFDRQ
jgi:hypothetical protein